jgi:glycine cleavage system H protein
MSNIPADLKYTKSHEWVRTLASNVEVGITDHPGARRPGVRRSADAGKALKAGKTFAAAESASDVYAPVAGAVVGNAPGSQPELINSEPYGAGWIMRLSVGAGGAAFGREYEALARRG